MSISDYIGRSVDLVAYSGEEAYKDTLLTADLAQPGKGGEICTGIRKLAQRFLLELLTESGSVAYEPTRGCDFMLSLRKGFLRTPLDVELAFADSRAQIRSLFKSEESPTDVADEKLYNVDLLAAAVDDEGRVSITVNVISQSGSAAVYIFPINLTVI